MESASMKKRRRRKANKKSKSNTSDSTFSAFDRKHVEGLEESTPEEPTMQTAWDNEDPFEGDWSSVIWPKQESCKPKARLQGSRSSDVLCWPDNRILTPLGSPISLHLKAPPARSLSAGVLSVPVPPTLRRKTMFFGEYSMETKRLLRTRNNSHFLPSTRATGVSKLTSLSRAGGHLLGALSIWASFYYIAVITLWNPYLKILHYSGRMLFPVLDRVVGVNAADYSLWLGGQLGFYRALGRVTGGWRMIQAGVSAPPRAEGLGLLLYYLHWIFGFLYFPSEHLGLVAWEGTRILGVKPQHFFVQVNAVVWYWRQVFSLLLLCHAVSSETFAVPTFPAMLYALSLAADLFTAYAFLPSFKYRPSRPVSSLMHRIFISRTCTIGLGTHGLLGVADGLLQVILRSHYA
eukprot:TRINITY_DN30382_c0_g1_i1.p1 TRINITY_DN30382_c0_g1~~TRINITY_DN30382_c0_g1_i1.p1  ORF type:complete len:419 (+),score=42.49 TRINITY_DN30382_c0_g1_i1:45-1259(+)